MAEKKTVFTKDVEVPDIVMQKAESAFEKIRMEEADNMKKSGFRKVRKSVAVAALGCVVAVGGISVYAGTSQVSLLSLFDKDNEVKENATKLMNTEVKQGEISKQEIKDWLDINVEEAVCDNNMVYVSISVKAKNPDKYFPMSGYRYSPDYEDQTHMSDFGIGGAEGKLTPKQYADKCGKEMIIVDIFVDGNKSASQSISQILEKDGTMIYTINFENEEKSKQLNYFCQTLMEIPHTQRIQEDGYYQGDFVVDEFEFTLQDKSSSVEEVKYEVVSGQKVEGTRLVIDEVTLTKSDLAMLCKVDYHYTGDKSKWEMYEAEECHMEFFMLDEQGKIIETDEDTSLSETTHNEDDDDMTATDKRYYTMSELPDEITFVVKYMKTDELYGKFTVKKSK